MESKEITFNEHLEMYIHLDNFNDEICLTLSDGLAASDEELTNGYKERIANFINEAQKWYNKSVNTVLKYAKENYEIDAKPEDIELTHIFILFEQNEKELFGLEFRVEFDIEHGCGLKIKGSENNFEIIEIGTGDVAFC